MQKIVENRYDIVLIFCILSLFVINCINSGIICHTDHRFLKITKYVVSNRRGLWTFLILSLKNCLMRNYFAEFRLPGCAILSVVIDDTAYIVQVLVYFLFIIFEILYIKEQTICKYILYLLIVDRVNYPS